MSLGFIPLQGTTKKTIFTKFLKPVSNWYVNAAGYRKVGLRYVYRCFLLQDHISQSMHRLTYYQS